MIARLALARIQGKDIILVDTAYPSYNVQAKALTKAKESIPELKAVNAVGIAADVRT